ncbi:MAG: hypothetical protein GY856_27975 [bacterium]|nr:hypothetical protein [bacterium]
MGRGQKEDVVVDREQGVADEPRGGEGLRPPALVAATPEKYIEQSTAQVLEGRNWTSPTLAGGRLYLRNQEEIVSIDMRSR